MQAGAYKAQQQAKRRRAWLLVTSRPEGMLPHTALLPGVTTSTLFCANLHG